MESKIENRASSNNILKRFFKGDAILWVVIISLFVISLLVVYSSTASMAYMKAGGDTLYYFKNHLKFILLGILIIFLVHRVNYQVYAKFARPAFLVALGLMVLTFFIGVNLNDASRWLKVPYTSYTFQPADFLKVCLILVLAKELARRQATINKTPFLPRFPLSNSKRAKQIRAQNRGVLLSTTLPVLMPIVLTCGVVFFSNFSTSALIFLTCLVMLYLGRVRVSELWRLVIVTIIIVASALALMYAADIGRSRTWVNRLSDFTGYEQVDNVADDNLQIEQAKIAIATGGVIGKGPGKSTQRANLPHSYSDFAYAFVVEEYGLLGGGAVLALYLWLFYRTIDIFRRCKRAFPALLVLGLGVMIVLQAVFNMLVSVSLFPVTGQTLPLISLGGSSMLFTCFALGMILGVSRQMQEETLDAEG